MAMSPTFRLYLRRYAGFTVGVYLMGLGIALVTNTHLGTTPISSLPYVLSLIFPLTLGTFTCITNVLMVAGQKMLLGPALGRSALWQIPAVFVFSIFIDINMWLTQPLVSTVYWWQMTMCVLGSLVLAAGIAVCIVSRVTVMPGDGLVLAIAHVAHTEFGRTKVMFDCSLVALAALVSLCFLHQLVGLREGTLLSAILTGTFVRMLAPWTSRLKHFFENPPKAPEPSAD